MTHERLVGDEPDPADVGVSSLAAVLPVADEPDELPPLMPPVFFPLPPEPNE